MAVVVIPDLAWLEGSSQHQLEVRKATESLLDGHVLFDYLIADQVAAENLPNYAAVMLPRDSHLAGGQAEALRQYVEAGGMLVVTGEGPELDDKGRPLAPPLRTHYVIHLVNYNVPLGVEGRDPLVQRGIGLALHVPGITAARVRCRKSRSPNSPRK